MHLLDEVHLRNALHDDLLDEAAVKLALQLGDLVCCERWLRWDHGNLDFCRGGGGGIAAAAAAVVGGGIRSHYGGRVSGFCEGSVVLLDGVLHVPQGLEVHALGGVWDAGYQLTELCLQLCRGDGRLQPGCGPAGVGSEALQRGQQRGKDARMVGGVLQRKHGADHRQPVLRHVGRGAPVRRVRRQGAEECQRGVVDCNQRGARGGVRK